MKTLSFFSQLWLFGLGFLCLFSSCEKDKSLKIIEASPIAEFEVTGSGCTAPCEVTFRNKSTNASSYEWYSNGQIFSISEDAINTFTQSGSYTIRLVAIGENDERDETEKSVVINGQNAGPIAGFTINNNNCKAPCNITFTNNSVNSIRYEWDFGDGANSAEKSPSHTYTTAGTYSVKLVAYDEDGQSSAPSVQTVSIIREGEEPELTACFTVANDECEAPCSVRFTNCSENAVSYSWNFDDGSPTVSSQNPSHLYSSAGEYQVTLTVRGSNGESKTHTKSVEITEAEIPEPYACFDVSTDECEAPCSISFFNCSEDAVSYEWDFDDGSTSYVQNPTHTFTEPGDYEVTLIAYNAEGEEDEISEWITIEEGEPEYNTAYVEKVEVYDMPLFLNLWDWNKGPDVYFAFSDDNSYGIGSGVIFDARSTPLVWNGNLNDPIPNNTRLSIHFYDYDYPYSPTYMGRSAKFRIQDYIDNEEFPDVLDISYPTDDIYVRMYLHWE